MSYKRGSLLFKSILLILKNATIIIPLIEGVVYSVHDLLHPQLEKEVKDVKAEERKSDPVHTEQL